jgi:hypothetical protein
VKKVLVVLGVLAAIAGGICAYASTKPDVFTVSRSRAVAAPPEVVQALLADFHNWPKWSPWEELDPNMKRTYGGAASGVGQTYEWKGNDKVGSGKSAAGR